MSAETVEFGDIIEEAESGFASGENLRQGLAQVRMNNVNKDGELEWDEIRRVPTDAARISQYSLFPGDIVFNSTNSPELVGKSALFTGFKEPIVFSNHFLRLRVRALDADPQFVAYWLHYCWKRGILQRLATRWVNQAAIRKDDLFQQRLTLPSLATQRTVSCQLRNAQGLRRTRRYALRLCDEFLAAAFLKMFGDLPTNSRRWDTVALGDLIHTGPQNGLYKPATQYGSGTPILRIDAFHNGRLSDHRNLKRVRLTDTDVSTYKLNADDVVINRVNSRSHLGKVLLIPALPEKTVFESNMMRFSIERSRINPIFLVQQLQTPFVTRQIQTAAKDAVNQASINQEDVQSIQIRLPPSDTQEHFAALARQHDHLRSTHLEALHQADHLFQTLLHQAFN